MGMLTACRYLLFTICFLSAFRIVFTTDRSKAIFQVLFVLCVALWPFTLHLVRVWFASALKKKTKQMCLCSSQAHGNASWGLTFNKHFIYSSNNTSSMTYIRDFLRVRLFFRKDIRK